jgi:hypothetical protein
VGKVVRLGDFRTRDSVSELRELLVKAARGDIAGITFAVELSDGTQRVGFTGKFRSDRAEAVKLAHHLGELLRHVENEPSDTSAVVQLRSSGGVTQLRSR